MVKSKSVSLRELSYSVGERLLDLAPNLATTLEWELEDEAVLTLQVSDLSLPAYFSIPSRQASCTFQEMMHNAVDVFGMHMWRASKSTFFSPVGDIWMVLRVFYAAGFSELEVQMNVSLTINLDNYSHFIVRGMLEIWRRIPTRNCRKTNQAGCRADHGRISN